MPFFEELKRRNVIKVGIAYAVVAWLVLQFSDVILNNIEAPGWVFQTILLLLGIGFLVAMFFSWAFEMTPEGLKREHEVDRSQSITPHTGKKLNNLIFAVMGLALAYFAYDKFVLDASRDAALLEAATQAGAEQAADEDTIRESDKSIAVLPFVNMSDDASNEYFSDGLSEELLNLLAKIPELRVIARTSSFAYKGSDKKIADVAQELNVGHVLEGSVRKSGNQVRITAQLIRASDSSHLWSETYDRSLEDIFAIQDEISSEVVAQLKVTLLGEVPKAEETDPEAYALYLQARQLGRRGNPGDWEQSNALYQQALAIDPNYATAWSGLAGNYLTQTGWGHRPIDEGYTLARETANQALALDPVNALAYAYLAQIEAFYDWDMGAAARNMERALALDPANPEILYMVADLVATLGRSDGAIAIQEYVVNRDPVNPEYQRTLGWFFLCARRLDEAIDSFRTALTLSPEYIAVHYRIGVALLLKGESQAALAEMQLEQRESKRFEGEVIVYHALGRKEESDAALATLIKQHEQSMAYNIAYVLAFRDEADLAFAWLDKAVRYKDTGLMQITMQPEFINIHNDPRWLPFLESIGMSPEQLAAIELKVALPE